MEHTTKNATANNTRHMDVHGHRVTIVFADKPDPDLSNIVRSALIDCFVEKHCNSDGTVKLTA